MLIKAIVMLIKALRLDNIIEVSIKLKQIHRFASCLSSEQNCYLVERLTLKMKHKASKKV